MKWNGMREAEWNGMREAEWNARSGSGMEAERKRNGSGTEAEWNARSGMREAEAE